jgi:Uma2 family endonuclease
MRLDVVDVDEVNGKRKLLESPYLIRLPGWTWKRYLAEAPEMRFCEYERGDLIVHSPVGFEHQRLVRFMTLVLHGWCERKRAGEALNGPAVVKVAQRIGREPDIFVIAPTDIPRLKGKVAKVVPLLTVEVTSPSTRKLDLETKASEYAALGVPEYWVVERDKRVLYQHLLRCRRYEVQCCTSGALRSKVLPGFWIDVDWLWRERLPSELECLKKLVRSDRQSSRKRKE